MDHKAMGQAGVWTARFGERSEYEGSRAAACPIAHHEVITSKTTCRKN